MATPRFRVPQTLARQCAEQPLDPAVWIDRCAQRLCDRLPDWPPTRLAMRAAALWRVAGCMPPEEAAEIASAWWSADD